MNMVSKGDVRECFLIYVMILISGCRSSEVDRLALLDIKESSGGNGLSFWNDSLHFCEWQGVVCGKNHHQRVVSLDLDKRSLVGSLSPSIGNLTFIRRISFGYNKLRGTIPKEIGSLRRLQYLDLGDNELSGHIPVEMMNCSDLRMLHLGSNRLTGSIPFEVGFLSKLHYLMLYKNNLSGSIPSSVGYLSELQELWLTENKLTGTISSFIGNLSSLAYLSLGSNLIVGEIPFDIDRLKNLTLLHLSDNRLSGTVPASLYNLSFVTEISLTDNHLHGEFMPNSELLNVPRLTSLILGGNRFTGSIPVALLNISTLQLFDAPYNNLTGWVPSNLGVLKNLQKFNVETNELGTRTSGDLEFLTSLGNASMLSVLSLKSNQFGGEFPASFFNSSMQLKLMTVGGNRISGRIPDEIGKLVNLILLGLEDNDLEGVIPKSIGKLIKLEKLYLNQNRLAGSIPDSIGNLSSLFFLNLQENSLEGEIPLSLKQCTHLDNLFLFRNKLSGEIPKNFLSQFEQLTLLDLGQNMFTGAIPSEVGNSKHLRGLTLSYNKFSGEIPVQLAECTGLEFLSISGNYLEGSIPSSLSKLKSLQYLDVSRNNLSGRIPTGLENLTVMWYFNISFNKFEGRVPTGGVFGNYSGFLFEGNSKLCGGIPHLHLPRCSTKRSKSRSTLIIILISITTLGVIALMIACSLLYKRHKMRNDSSSISSEGNVLSRVSYKDLYDATSGFNPSNLIGSGSIGSVYKAFLSQEQKQVAVKVLNLQKHGASKTFRAECRSLGTVRHRNLLKILTTCSSIDYKGNEFMALVFDLMPNGNLENWLHESRNFSFGQRLDAAIDIASALDYLHNGCVPLVAHCDLKPSNVLLDQDMVAHVGDFGLARVLNTEPRDQSRDQTSSNAVKGSIGYIPPEYGMGAKVSTQGDVYSFGILLLEMITGMRPTHNLFSDGISIHEYVKRALPDRALDIMDSSFITEFEENQMAGRDGKDTDEKQECLVSLFEIGISCSVENPGGRMDIKNALNALVVLKTKLLKMEGHVNRIRSH